MATPTFKPHISLVGGKKKPVPRNKFERGIVIKARQQGKSMLYEKYWLNLVIPIHFKKYKPDFILENGIIVEGKGLLESDDRKKMIIALNQFTNLDIRFCFSYARSKIYKGSKTSCAKWAVQNGFKWCEKFIPLEWHEEPEKPFNLYKLQLEAGEKHYV